MTRREIVVLEYGRGGAGLTGGAKPKNTGIFKSAVMLKIMQRSVVESENRVRELAVEGYEL